MDVVRRRMGVDAPAVLDRVERTAVLLAHRHAPAYDLQQPDLHDVAIRALANRADDDAVGADLLPPVERDLLVEEATGIDR